MRKIILTICLVMLVIVCTAKGDLWYSSGYNTFTDSDPQWENIFVENDAILDFLSGNAVKLELMHTATANIYGGTMTTLWTGDSSVANLHYCIDIDDLAAFDNSIINLYTIDFILSSEGGRYGYGYIEGIYYNTTMDFHISFYDDTSYSHINTIPEPATFLSLVLGGFLLRKRK